MNKPSNRFGGEGIFKSTVTPGIKFAPNAASSYSMDSQSQETTKFVPNGRIAAFQKLSQIEQRQKVSKQIKSEILSSLTGSISSSLNPVIGSF